jgi:hypothetical protein
MFYWLVVKDAYAGISLVCVDLFIHELSTLQHIATFQKPDSTTLANDFNHTLNTLLLTKAYGVDNSIWRYDFQANVLLVSHLKIMPTKDFSKVKNGEDENIEFSLVSTCSL